MGVEHKEKEEVSEIEEISVKKSAIFGGYNPNNTFKRLGTVARKQMESPLRRKNTLKRTILFIRALKIALSFQNKRM